MLHVTFACIGLESSADASIDSSVFISPQLLHLTVCMLKLYGEERLQQAQDVMQSIGGLHSGKPLSVELVSPFIDRREEAAFSCFS